MEASSLPQHSNTNIDHECKSTTSPKSIDKAVVEFPDSNAQTLHTKVIFLKSPSEGINSPTRPPLCTKLQEEKVTHRTDTAAPDNNPSNQRPDLLYTEQPLMSISLSFPPKKPAPQPIASLYSNIQSNPSATSSVCATSRCLRTTTTPLTQTRKMST